MDTLFADTSTALQLSWLITTLPSSRPSGLRHALIAILESMPVRTYQQSATLARLIGSPSESVNFAGLSREEIHGQCALIVDTVRRRLYGVEYAAVVARFAPTEATMRAGVCYLADYLLAAAPIGNRDALEALIWRRYVPRRYRNGYALRAIENRTGVSKSTLARAYDWLNSECGTLELRALRRLEETFVPDGVCAAVPMWT
jgi:hypothetical protein